MIQFVKFLAFTIGLAFSGTDSVKTNHSVEENLNFANEAQITSDTLKNDRVDLGESQIPMQPSDHHNCGLSHVFDVMRKEDPDFDKKLEHFTNVTLPELQKQGRIKRKNRPANRQAQVLNMPIVFHIIHKPGEAIGTGQNLTDQTIIDQLETLNEDLNAANSGWANVPARWESIKGNPEMQFCLAEFDPQGNATTGIVRHEYTSVPSRDFIRNTIKPQTHWPTQNYYNVWILPIPGTTAFGGVLGWAFFPGAHGSNFDGTVQDYRFTGKGGKTLTHEVGHSFGLPHTWGSSGGCGNDDGIADTPLQAENTNSIQRMSCNGSTWPTGPTTCSEEHMYINYMDYSPDACALTFTIGQGDAMRGIAEGVRVSLINNAPNVSPSCEIGTPTGGGNPGGGGPPITIELDAGIQTIIQPVNGEFCSSEEITPIVLLTNDFGDTPLTSCVIRYKISGTPGSVAFNWTGNLAKGEDEEVSLAPFISPEYSFEFTAWTTSPNGGDDENGFNDEKAISLSTPEVFDPNIFEDFEDETSLPTSTNIVVLDPGSTFREWELTDISAYGVGDESVYFRNFSDPDGDGQFDILEFPVMDFSEIENPRLAFDVAYYNINNFAQSDSLRIRVSADCGDTYQTVFYEGGEDLATVSASQPVEFFPEPNQWKNEVIELFQYTGSDRFIIEITNIGYGNNNVYIDNINLSDGCASSVQVDVGDLTCGDECNGYINLILNGFVQAPDISWSNNVNGQTGESLEDLCVGTYSVTVIDNEFDCEFIQDIEVTSPDELELILSGNDITIPGVSNGSVDAQGFGGTGFYTFEWDTNSNPPDTDAFLFGLSPGVYCVTLTDQAGCTKTDCVEIFGFECEMEVTVEITQPDCNGMPGSGVVTITGAQTPNIIWSQGGPPQTGGFLIGSPVNTNLQAGQLFVSIIDTSIDDCEETFFFEIYPAVIPNLNEVIENETGPGNNDGSITLNVDGTSEYTYEWSTGTSTTEELTGIGEGTYMVTITDVNNDCEYVETYTITNLNCTLSATADITPVTCFEDTDGEIEIMPSGGVPPYTYMWPSGPSFPAQFNLAAGIYPVTVLDDDGCRFIVEAIVEQPALLTTILTTTDESSPGAIDGSVSAQIFGGTMPYQTQWSNNATNTEMITGLSGGIYLITITDANGCTAIKGASVEGLECPTITIEESSSPANCFGASDGVATVTATGGAEPYTYLWTPGDYTTPSVDVLTAGDYTVVITDNDGCPANASFTITEPAEFSVSLDGTNETSLGAMDGSIQSTISGGVGTLNYAWSGPPSFSANVPNISLLSPAEYCLVITDETNCTAEACFTISAGADPCTEFTANNVSLELAEPISCAGETDGVVIAIFDVGTSPFTYQWSNNENGEVANNVGPGLISVTITDANDCELIFSDFLVEEIPPISVTETVVGLSAPGANDGSISITSANTVGITTCLWTGPNNYTNTSCDGIMNLEPGTYIFTITDENDCEFSETYVVEGEADPCFGIDISISFDVTNESTIGASDGALEAIVSGTNNPIVSYTWTDQNSNTYTGNPIENLPPGLYTLVVADEAGCMGVGSAEVADGADPCVVLPTLELFGNIISCRGDETGEVSVIATGDTGPYTYLWSEDSETASVSGLPAGTYTVTVSDANDCTSVGSVEISEPALALNLSATSINESVPGANNGSASANLSGGDAPYEYSWTGPNGFSSEGQTIMNLAPGEYCVLAIDLNGCERESCVTVQAANDPCVNTEIEVQINPGTLDCVTTEVEVSYEAFGGQEPYTVVWSVDDQTTETIVVTQVGEISILVMDANGCMGEASAIINSDINEPEFSLSLGNPSSTTAMDGSAEVIDFNSENISVSWFDETGTNIGDNLMIDGLPIGTYTVIVVNNENGCESTEEFILQAESTDCTSFSISVALEDITCVGADNGLAQIDVSNGTGPFTYEWDPALPDSPIQTDLGPGVYQVLVTDANGCMDEAEFELSDPTPLSLEIDVTAVSAPNANDGMMMALVDGGTSPYTFLWSNFETGQTIDNLSPGEYCVTVVDENGCPAELCATLEEEVDNCADFEVDYVFTSQISCFEANDGALQVNIINAAEPVSFTWSDGLPADQQQTDLGPGVYSVTVIDANDCVFEGELELTEPESELNIQLSSTVVSSTGAADGSATVVATGGNEGVEYTYIWDDAASQTTATATGLSSGEYCVTVGSGGCSAVDCIEVFDADNPCIDFAAEINTTDASCFGECDGTAEIIVTGGEEPYQFTWSDGGTGEQERTDLCGIGGVTVTDANDCVTILEFAIDVPDELEVVTSSVNATDLTSGDGSANAAGFGGTPPYEFTWDNSTIGTTLNNLDPDTYTVTVTDANECTAVGSVIVGVGEDDCSEFQGTLEIQDISCFGEDDGVVTVIAEGGFGTYLYDWSSSNTLGATQSNSAAGDFVVVITDQNQCELVLQGTVNEPEQLVITIVDTQETSAENMSDGSASIAISGGTGAYDISWSDGLGSELEVDGLSAGEYVVTVEDENGCTSSEVIIITDGDGGSTGDCDDLIASFAITPVTCYLDSDGSVEVTASGGTPPYEITSSIMSLVGLPATTFVVTVEDAAGCTFEEEVTVPSPNQLIIQAEGNDGDCGLSSSATAIVSGGTPPFTIIWDNAETGPIINGLETGTYGVTVTDNNGCTNTSEVSVVTDFMPLDFEVNTVDATCSDLSDGSISIDIFGATATEVDYLWSDGVITEDRLNLPGGTYTVTITDENGCEYILSRDILSPDEIAPNYSINQGSTNSIFDVTMNPSGGTPPYSYSWSDGSTSFINEGLGFGTYICVITDANDCERSVEVVVDGSVAVLDNLDSITDFTLSPNPTTGEFIIEVTLNQPTELQVTVYDILGQQIYNGAYRGTNIQERLDLNGKASGTYFVRLHNEFGQLTKKLIKVD